MKKIFTFFFASAIVASASAQDCSDIFISEYVEGWSNNKALELYNPTANSIDLSGYFVSRYSNGSNTALVKNSIQLTGTIAPYSTYVGVIDKRDENGTGQEAPVWDSLQARADGYYCPDYNASNAFYWNGNDAIVLYKGTLTGSGNDALPTNVTIVDVFGKVGEDPGNPSNGGGWSTDFPYTGAGVVVSTDHSLIRKSTVKNGTGSAGFVVSFFNALEEYDSIPATTYLFDTNGDTITSQAGNPIRFGNWFTLGSHTCDCLVGIEDEATIAFDVYPNPSNGTINISSAERIKSVEVYSVDGRLVQADNNLSGVNLTSLTIASKGLFVVRVTNENGIAAQKRVVIK